MSDTSAPAPARRRVKPAQVVAFAFGLVIVVLIFTLAIPRFADYQAVWRAMKTLTPIEFWSLMAVMVFNLYTYWLANQAGLIGMSLGQSAVLTQTSTTVANTLPAGGALAIGMTAAMLNSWGFTAGEITLFVGVTGIWNIFAKLGMPLIALVLLVLTGHTSPGLVTAALIGAVVLVVAVTLLVLVFRSERLARKVGDGVGRAGSALLRLFRKGPIEGMGERTAKFRRETIILAKRRWFMLTWTTVLSQVALFFVLLLTLRHMSVAEAQVPAVEAFAVYAFSRLLSAIPITPGGVGVIDLGYIAGLTAFDSQEKAQIVAAVLIFRVLTYGIQIPIGILTYVFWRRKRSWWRVTPPPGSIAAELDASHTDGPAASQVELA
ncbi:MAG: lysylphosphatidylglycerol synthase transmembrane domain-containing protein [Planctomycetaceae bacterium]